MTDPLDQQIRDCAKQHRTPFYLYARADIAARCRAFLDLPYDDTAIHFATMANASPTFLRIVQGSGLGVFVNSPGHLSLALELGFRGAQIVFTSSAMPEELMRAAQAAGCVLNLDSVDQLERFWRLFPDQPVGLRCNIGDLVEPRATRAGYFLGRESRLGLDPDELQAFRGDTRISGLHIYVGTDLLDLDYFRECYARLLDLARGFPALRFVDFGGGFGLARPDGQAFPLDAYGRHVAEMMRQLSADLGRSVKLILEPGRIIGGDAGRFVCRVTDVKQRNGRQLIGVDASSAQFPRPLFYPDDARHPVALLDHATEVDLASSRLTSVYGCSTYSRDYLARDVQLPAAAVGDLLVFSQAGSYCASAHTHFLGFPVAPEFFV